MNTLTARDALRGCRAGRMQSVGLMQVVPLILTDLELEDDRFQVPTEAYVGTATYGTIIAENKSDKPMIIPAHAAYMTKQRTQDHAMVGAGLVAKKSRAHFDNAVCIEANQPNTISIGQHRLAILPLGLRETATSKRHKGSSYDGYSRMWDSIGQFNTEAGIPDRGNMKLFFERYAEQLDSFVAQFELVPDQIGAIVLLDGVVVGLERAPSRAWWTAVWEPLIRSCYGAQAVAVQKRKSVMVGQDPPATRVPLFDDADSLEDLERMLESVEAEEDERARALVRDMVAIPMAVETDQQLSPFTLQTAKSDQWIGQIVRDGDAVMYASMVIATGWDRRRAYHEAEQFEV